MSDELTLKEYINDKFLSLEKSTENNRISMEKRLDGMNEFRSQLKDQASQFLTRLEYEAKHELLDNKITSALKILYMGVGVVFILEVLLRFLIR
jgi:hypothetical protein